jgi:hypothetical protein
MRCLPDRLHQLLFGCAMLQGSFGVTFDAIRTLCHVSYGDRDNLLSFRGQGAFGKYLLGESFECCVGFRR